MPMIRRDLAPVLRRAATQYPVVTLTGPRQSGKTTLCRAAFPRKPYVSLEPMDRREYARRDPRGFLAEYPQGAIFDEIQNVPESTSFLVEPILVYGGNETQRRRDARVVPWSRLDRERWW